MKIEETDKITLRRLEEDLWREETRFDAAYMDNILAEDFIEYGRSGKVYSRADTLAVPRQAIHAVLPLPDLKVRLLTDDVAQITYNSVVTYGGEVQHGRRSSIWMRADSGWVLKFHQGTPFIPATR